MKTTHKSFIQKIKTHSFARIASFVATFLAVSLLTATGASAWGPERATFTMEDPATYPTFNSITNNPTIGDERDFVRVGEINADVTELTNEVEVIPGKQYLVYVYFHNNASSTYNDSAHNHEGVAVATRMSSAFSTVLTPAERATISATITANNSNPGSVWDEAYMTTSYDKVLLRYVEGSAKIYNDWGANGSIMPSSLFTEEGTLIGLNELNGVIPGCEEYHGVVSYVLEASELAGSVKKEVSKDGTNFADSVDVAPGDEVSFLLTIKNAGDVALTNATISDAMPSGLELVSGSVQLSANNSGVWDTLSDNIIGDGYNLGTIGTGNTVYIAYRAKVSENIDCGSIKLNNQATLTYDSETSSGDTSTSSATILVNKDGCATPENCATNPNLPGCSSTTGDCNTNPNLPGCNLPTEIVKTGPLEIAMAVIVVLGISAAAFYLIRTRRTLKTVQDVVSGDLDGKPVDSTNVMDAIEKVDSETKTTNPNNTVAPTDATPSDNAPSGSLATGAQSEANSSAPTSASTPSDSSSPLTPAGFSTPADDGLNDTVSGQPETPTSDETNIAHKSPSNDPVSDSINMPIGDHPQDPSSEA